MATLKTKIDSDETELYRAYAKVYRFATSEWKERGDGEVVVAKSDKFSRVLLHRDGTGKLAVNFPICELKVEQMGTNVKATTVACMDYSDDNKGVTTVFAFKFKEEEECKKFQDIIYSKETQIGAVSEEKEELVEKTDKTDKPKADEPVEKPADEKNE